MKKTERTRQGWLLSTLLFDFVLKVFNNTIRQDFKQKVDALKFKRKR